MLPKSPILKRLSVKAFLFTLSFLAFFLLNDLTAKAQSGCSIPVCNGNDLVTNGDFELGVPGTPGFSLGSAPFPSSCNALYAIDVDAAAYTSTNIPPLPTWATHADHTSGTGKFMIVQTDCISPELKIWETSFNASAGETFQFRFFVSNLSPDPDYTPILLIKGLQAQTIATVVVPYQSNSANKWQEVCISVTPTPGSYPLYIYAQGKGVRSSAIGLDDISIKKVTSFTATVTPMGPVNLCQGQELTLTANITPPPVPPNTDVIRWYEAANPGTVLTSGSSYSISNTLAPGTYTYYAKVTRNGCTITTNQVIVNVYPKPIVTITSPANNHVLCPNEPLLFNVAVSPGLPPGQNYTYQWYKKVGSNFVEDVAGRNQNPYTPTPGGAGTYKVVVTSPYGCPAEKEITILSFDEKPVITGPASTCQGSTVRLDVTEDPAPAGGYTSFVYTWKDAQGNSLSTMDYVIVSDGVYTVDVTYYPGGCTVTSAPFTVARGSAPVANAGPDQSICAPSSTRIGTPAISGYSYNWTSNPAGLTITNPSDAQPFVSAAGVYTVKVTDANGCTAMNDMVLSHRNPSADVDPAGPLDLCEGATQVLRADECTPCTYQWYLNSPSAGNEIPGETLSSITVSSTGTYYIKITDVTGCSAFSSGTSVTFHPTPSPTITPASASFCQGGSVLLQGNSGYSSYTWYKNNTGSTPIDFDAQYSATTSGTYILVVTDLYGCTGRNQRVVTMNDTPRVTMLSGGEPIVNNELHMCPGTKEICARINNIQAGHVYTYEWNKTLPVGSSMKLPVVTPCLTVSEAGQYYVVVTDVTTGCKGRSATITVIVDPVPTANAGTDRTICLGTSTVIGTPAISGYNYVWTSSPAGFASASAQPAVTPVVTTTYTLTVIDIGSGCSASDQVTVTVVNSVPPLPLTGYLYDGGCAGETFTFTAAPLGAAGIYEWDMDGDGDVDDIGNPLYYTFPSGGYFVVGVRLRETLCNKTSPFYYPTQPVQVIPSSPGYNENCCSEGVEYDYTNPILGLPTSVKYNWTNQTLKIKGTVTIQPGTSLTIDNSTIEFAPFARIIVERGAYLDIKNNSVLKGLSSCGNMWHGIEVWGIEGSPQKPDNIPSVQGVIKIAQSTIEDAHFGVFLGHLNECYSTPPGTPCGPIFMPGFGGGKISTTFGTFRNNGISLLVAPYANQAVFNKVDWGYFVGGSVKDPAYKTNSGSPYPNTQNKFYGRANSSGKSPVFVQVNNSHKMKLRSCNFHYGVSAIQLLSSTIDVSVVNNQTNLTTFFGLKYGVEAYNSLSSAPLSFNLVNKAMFQNCSQAEIYMSATRNDLISGNLFGPSAYGVNYSSDPLGVYMLNSSNYQLYDNKFRGLRVGFKASTTNQLGGLVRGSGNGKSRFAECEKAIVVSGTTPALQVICNTFEHGGSASYINTWDVSGSFANQGTPGTPARNMFPNASYKLIKSINPFTYYRNRSYRGDAAILTPAKQGPITVSSNQEDIWKENCLLSIVMDPVKLLGQLGVNKGEQEAIAAKINELSSSGQSSAILLSAIADASLADEFLIPILRNGSPLSDEVLVALLAERSLAEMNLMEVFKLNLPASSQVWHQLSARSAAFSEANRNLLEDLQGTGSINTLAKLEREASALSIERQELINQLMNIYSEKQEVLAAGNLLVAEEHPGNIQHGVAILIETGELATAAEGIARLEADPSVDRDWIALANMHLGLKQTGRSVFEMNKDEEQLVRAIAYHTPVKEAVLNAQAILRMVYREEFEMEESLVVAEYSSQESQTKQSALSPVSASLYMGPAYPNPSEDVAYVNCYVPANAGEASLELCDLLGRAINVHPLQAGVNRVQLDTRDLKEGIYLYVLRQDGKKLGEGKLAVVKP